MPLPPRLLRFPILLALVCASCTMTAQIPPSPSRNPAAGPEEAPSFSAFTPYNPVSTDGPRNFMEIWAYLMAGEESFLPQESPLSDLGYFAAEITSSGELARIPDRKKLKDFKGRVHLVLAETGNFALSHFVLDPALPLRAKLVADLLKAVEEFDGLQVDFEAVLRKDKENYLSFLRELKAGMGSKILGVAIPARTRAIDEVWDYPALAGICDRIIIMAYDEHWSGSKPGSIASLEWCRRVADYARAVIPPGKLVMGQPFYGRSWADKSLAKAFKHSAVAKVMAEKNIAEPARKDGIPFFEYQETVNIQVYYEDAASTLMRSGLYASMGVENIAFWRLGQEDPAIWKGLGLAPVGPLPSPAASPGPVLQLGDTSPSTASGQTNASPSPAPGPANTSSPASSPATSPALAGASPSPGPAASPSP